MSLLKTVHSFTSAPPFSILSAPEAICSATFGETRRAKRSRATISASTFFPRMFISMNIAAWFATAVTSSRSFGWKTASDSLSSQRMPRTSSLCISGTTIAELIRLRIMLFPLAAAKSIAASWVSTAARSFITWFKIVDDTVIGESAPSRRRLTIPRSSPVSSRKKTQPRSARVNLKIVARIFSSRRVVSRSSAISRESSCDMRKRS